MCVRVNSTSRLAAIQVATIPLLEVFALGEDFGSNSSIEKVLPHTNEKCRFRLHAYATSEWSHISRISMHGEVELLVTTDHLHIERDHKQKYHHNIIDFER